MAPPDPEKAELAQSFDYYGERLWWTYDDIVRRLGPETWSGSAADTFASVMNDFKRDIEDLMPLYKQTARNIRNSYDIPETESPPPPPMPAPTPGESVAF